VNDPVGAGDLLGAYLLFGLVLIRCSGVAVFAPFFGGQQFPVMARVGLVFFFAPPADEKGLPTLIPRLTLGIIIVAITAFVMLLLLYVIYRFNERSNPTPSKSTHNTMLEVAWTVLPILILVAIAIPSFRLLHLQYSYPKADLTLKATGYTWYWEHGYPELGISFETRMLDDEARQALIAENIPAPRNLAVDNEVIVPVNKVVNVLVTAAPDGVIHDWTIPSFGSKVDAVPGRVTHMWFQFNKTGEYRAYCREYCGTAHAYMLATIKVVTAEEFEQWLKQPG